MTKFRDRDGVGKAAFALTIIGLVCWAYILFPRGLIKGLFEPAPDIPDPVPDLEITSVIGALDEFSVIHYYNHVDYPDGPPVEKGHKILYQGEDYILTYITNGLVSTEKGDCWELVYRAVK